MGLRATAFLLLFAALQLSWQMLRGSRVEQAVVHDGIVRPAVALVNLLTPEIHARAVNYSLQAAGGGLNVLNGCEGLEAQFLLWAAFLVAPLGASSRWRGLLLGTGVVFVTNQARLLVLFYAYRADPGLFDLLHATVLPIALVALVGMFFHAWLSAARRDAADAA